MKELRELIEVCNKARDAYYNENSPVMSDYDYDELFDKIQQLEKETRIVYPDSPTQNVGYDVVSELRKVRHNHPMLSLGKTKSVSDLLSFIQKVPDDVEKNIIAMLKMDGLTVSLKYENYQLVSAETRGNGEVGEDVLHNAKVISNIPQKIAVPNLIVDGEMIIKRDVFEAINSRLTEDEKYKNPRNLASGSLRQLDSKTTKERGLSFIAWKCIDGITSNLFHEQLESLKTLGFEVVPYSYIPYETPYGKVDFDFLEAINTSLQKRAVELNYPIDGLVYSYNDMAFSQSLGATGHHLRSQLAFKFYDEEEVTTLREIEWSMGKTGVLTPVAVFDSVSIDGTDVERASLHNVTYCKNMHLNIGNDIAVYKANAIIPQIKENLSKDITDFVIPTKCPFCGSDTTIKKDNDSEILLCSNSDCTEKKIKSLSYFVSKPGMNIDGLSEETIRRLVELGYLFDYDSIYQLKYYEKELKELDGFGERSVDVLLNSIEKSRQNVSMTNCLVAFGIPLIGKSICKEITKFYHQNICQLIEALDNNDLSALSSLDGFGPNMLVSLQKWYDNGGNLELNGLLSKWFCMEKPMNEEVKEQVLVGKTFVITGSLNTFSNREEAKDKIESLGGKVSGSVSAKTTYLVNNDKDSTTGKNKKAKELNISIISEEELINLFS